uniref:C2 domain-containing protein n=1 Tax=Octactis speculum TaxID=3111310 RepID=A0A6U3VGT9_9STRA|mmetsp:Transcript_4648/g.5556  ORF Transcript_4648/g.5556 Transcript_4648/m.5556 type:complete len:334 (+) Transcript_4648:126-1127(+)
MRRNMCKVYRPVRCQLINARGLRAANGGEARDPFVCVSANEGRTRLCIAQSSSQKEGDVNPDWNEETLSLVKVSKRCRIDIIVCDRNTCGVNSDQPEFLGQASVIVGLNDTYGRETTLELSGFRKEFVPLNKYPGEKTCAVKEDYGCRTPLLPTGSITVRLEALPLEASFCCCGQLVKEKAAPKGSHGWVVVDSDKLYVTNDSATIFPAPSTTTLDIAHLVQQPRLVQWTKKGEVVDAIKLEIRPPSKKKSTKHFITLATPKLVIGCLDKISGALLRQNGGIHQVPPHTSDGNDDVRDGDDQHSKPMRLASRSSSKSSSRSSVRSSFRSSFKS